MRPTNGQPYATDTATDTRSVRNLYRVTVATAAERLGITQDAVRQRIRRDTIRHDKDENGRVYVYLDSTHTDHDTVQDGVHDSVQDGERDQHDVRDELVDELRSRVRYLEEESRRKDHLLAAALERIPAIEAAPEPREPPQTASEHHGSGTAYPEDGEAEKRSWWRRVFLGE
jgi:hypothetical protein